MTKFRPEWTDLSDDEFPDDVLEELKEFVRSTARKTKDERIEEVLVEHVDCECCNNKTSSFLPAELLVEEHTSKNDLDITTGNQNSEEDQSYSNRNYNSDETEETIVQGSSQKHAIILLLSSSSDEEDKVQENVGGGQTTESSQLSLANDFQNLQLSHSDEESKLSVDQSKESSSDSSSIGWINGIPFRDPNQVTNLMSTSEDDDKKSNRGTSMTKKPTVGKKKRIIFSDDSSWSEKESSEASQKGNSRQVQQSPRPRSLPKRTIYDLETSSSEEEFEASGIYDALDSNSYNNDQLSSDGDIDDDSDDDSFIENDAVLDDISVERPKLDRGFKKRREILAQQYFQEFDKKVFHGKLSDHTTVKWSSKLRTTAGHTKLRTIRAEGQAARCSSMIELSTKVLDSDTRLRSTLLHECCHAAAFLMDGITKPPHGKCFQKWANRSMARFPDIIVTTTHSYEIQFRYAWACETPKCGAVFKRHSRSIDPSKQVCGRCKGKLVEVDSKSVNSGGDFIPKKRAPLSEYNTFVRNETASARRDLQRANEQRGIPDKVSQSEVMKELARRWKESKSSSTARMEANSS